MIEVSETGGLAIGAGVAILAVGTLGYTFVLTVLMHTYFDAYLSHSHPDLTVGQRYAKWIELSYRPDELRVALAQDETGALEVALSSRDQLVRFYQWVVVIGVGVAGAIGLFKFLTYIYTKGQQAG